MANDGADVTCRGRAFQILEAATGKARSPTVDNRVRRTVSDGGEAERKRRRALVSSDWQSSSARYDGCGNCWYDGCVSCGNTNYYTSRPVELQV